MLKIMCLQEKSKVSFFCSFTTSISLYVCNHAFKLQLTAYLACYGRFYGALDYVVSPQQIAAALDMFGFAPGLEYAQAVHLCEDLGVQVG
jgi:hypothetical protein